MLRTSSAAMIAIALASMAGGGRGDGQVEIVLLPPATSAHAGPKLTGLRRQRESKLARRIRRTQGRR